MSTSILQAKNLGPESAKWLAQVGIHSLSQLADVGVFEAFWQVRQVQTRANFNLVYAMQAALLDLPWQQIPPSMRDQLRRDWEAFRQRKEEGME